jgi:hypothetical protein
MIPTDKKVIARMEKSILRGDPFMKVRVSYGLTHPEFIKYLNDHASLNVVMYMIQSGLGSKNNG